MIKLLKLLTLPLQSNTIDSISLHHPYCNNSQLAINFFTSFLKEIKVSSGSSRSRPASIFDPSTRISLPNQQGYPRNHNSDLRSISLPGSHFRLFQTTTRRPCYSRIVTPHSTFKPNRWDRAALSTESTSLLWTSLTCFYLLTAATDQSPISHTASTEPPTSFCTILALFCFIMTTPSERFEAKRALIKSQISYAFHLMHTAKDAKFKAGLGVQGHGQGIQVTGRSRQR